MNPVTDVTSQRIIQARVRGRDVTNSKRPKLLWQQLATKASWGLCSVCIDQSAQGKGVACPFVVVVLLFALRLIHILSRGLPSVCQIAPKCCGEIVAYRFAERGAKV